MFNYISSNVLPICGHTVRCIWLMARLQIAFLRFYISILFDEVDEASIQLGQF